jgi:threonine aldolase
MAAIHPSVDFRSDTVTWPTDEMRAAMASADLGDDVYGEDPTVTALENLVAEMLGKEAGLFVTSGTQGNLIAALSHAQRGNEAILGDDAHTFCWEAGGIAVLGGITLRPLPTNQRGRLNLEQVRQAIRGDDPHWPRSRLILLENSSGGNHGAAIEPEYFEAVSAMAQAHGLKIHLDGARLFNATTALGVPPVAITQWVDSVSVCLSKGLCAPVGSVLVGSEAFIHQARRHRKLLGGGMRQAGVLAAAGLISLKTMTQRLQDDHDKARQLAQGLATISGIDIDPKAVETNLVFFDLTEAAPVTPLELVKRLNVEHGLHIGGYHDRTLRAVTHYWIQPPQVERLVKAIRTVLA